jgi:hypothetical protein
MGYTKDIGLRDFYKYYKETAIKKNRSYVDYKTYSKILKEFNLEVRTKIIYNSETLTLPFKLGKLFIHKFQNTFTEDNKRNWRVNYKLSKEQNMIIYHGSMYGYKWKWSKVHCGVKGKRYYSFKPCRTASRLIADAVNNKQLDFYN